MDDGLSKVKLRECLQEQSNKDAKEQRGDHVLVELLLFRLHEARETGWDRADSLAIRVPLARGDTTSLRLLPHSQEHQTHTKKQRT